ncbi:MAG: response regulator transcription factor [Usitatibacter sp.]
MATTLLEVFSRMITSAPRALVVDDHPIVADAMATAISAMRIFERVDCANSLPEACGMLEANPVCNLAVVDLHLREVEGRTTLTGLRERFPEVPVLVFSGDEALESITMAFECGARGYVTKSSPMSVVTSAIRLVIAGGSYIPPEAAEMLGFTALPPVAALPSRGAPAIRLSGRQQQVFRLLLQGMPNKVIGSRLAMAEGTVKAHLNTVFRVLGVRTRVEAILRARALGML